MFSIAIHPIPKSGSAPEPGFETRQNWVGVRPSDDPGPPVPASGRESTQAERLEVALKLLPEAGAEIFGFRLVRELGRGAFGRVFLATQSELAGREVALKVSADLTGESRALAQLQHTNIVQVYSTHHAGLLQGVCMPYFGSTTMADLLKRYRTRNRFPATGRQLVETLRNLSKPTRGGDEPDDREPSKPRPEAEADSILTLLSRESYVRAICWLGARLSDGLAHAHERGLLHRDIKPANVLITDYGQPMLLDFGIAEDLKLRSSLSSAVVAGTVPYMAPEHLEELRTGRPQADARSDVYALGIVLFELLTGRYPFRAPTASIEDEVPKLIAERNAGAPALRPLSRDITPGLESIVRTCLHPDPARRYQSAADLRDDLDRYLAYQPLKIAAETSYRERFNNWSRRHPLLTSNATLGAVVIAAMAGGGYAYSARHERLRRFEAEQSFRQFEGDTQSAKYLVYSGAGRPKLLDEGLAKTKAALDQYGVGEPDWDKRPSFAALPPERQAKLREELASLCVLMARGTSARDGTPAEKDAALRDAARWNDLAERVAGEAPRAVFAQRAKILKRMGRADEAEAAEKRAGDETAVWSAGDHAQEANDLLGQDRTAEALIHFRKAIRLDPKSFWAHIGEGGCHVALGRIHEARGSYTAAIALWPDVAWGYFNRGLVGLQLGDADVALEDLNKAAEIAPEFADIYWQRGLAFQLKGRFHEGLRDLEEAVRLGVPEEKILFVRSELHAKAGDAAAAKRDLDAALGRTPTDVAGWVERGRARMVADLPGALADFDRALELDPKAIHALLCRAYVLKRLEKYDEGLKALERAVLAAPENAHAWAGRGLLYARFQKWAAAEADAKEALALDAGPQIVYQVAAIYARLAEHDPAFRARALDLVTVAVKAGVGRSFLTNDPEFAAFRDNREFQRVAKGE